MTPIQLLATISMAVLAVYLLAGIATYIAVPVSLRRVPPTIVFILAWPLIWLAYDVGTSIRQGVEETDGLQWRDRDPDKWRDETRGNEP